MIIDNPIVSGSLNVQNAVTASNISIASTASAAYFTGSFIGDGTQLSGVTSYTDSDTLDYINSLGVLSGSAQIATDISGAFASTSQSLAQRIASQESFSQSLDATFATDTDLNLVSASVDALNAATSSYLQNTTDTLTGDLTVTGKITAQEFHTEFVSASIIYESGSTKFGDSLDDIHTITGSVNITGSLNINGAEVGTGKLDETVFNSYTSSTDQRLDTAEGSISSLNNASSSYALEANVSGAFADTSSSLAQRIDNISTDFDDITNKPTLISSSLQFNTLTTPFTGSFTGSFSGDGSGLTGVNVGQVSSIRQTFTNVVTKVVTHNLGTKNINVSVYDDNDQLFFPKTVTLTDDNTVTLEFSLTSSGAVVVSQGGHIVSGSVPYDNILNLPNLISSSAQFTDLTAPFTGSFTGSFYGDGSNLSGVTSYTDADTLTYINTLGVLSGSLQIASDISGAFDNTSSSLAQRITAQEGFSSSLDATFATDQQLSEVSGALALSISSISTDFADITNKPTLISSSAQIDSDISGSTGELSSSLAGRISAQENFSSSLSTTELILSGSFSGSFVGDGSQLSGVTSYTDADTLAFINSKAVLSGSIAELTAVTASFLNTGSVTIPHSFNSKNVSVSVYDSNDILIIPQEIALISNNAVKLTFGGATSGFAVVSKGGHIVSGSVPVPQLSTVTSAFTSTTSHTVTHNFNTKEVIVSVYENDSLIIPDTVTTDDVNNVTVTFPEAISGRVVVVKAGHIVSGSIPFDNLLDSPFSQDTGAISASKHIVPTADQTYDLGSPTQRFRDLYLSSASIYLGNTVISEDNVVTTASLQSVLPSGTLSGSAQIASDISGSFTLVSASIASERLKNTTDTLDGDLTVTGKITAQEFHTEFVSASIVYQSGSTKFGDTTDDTHEFIGNVGIGTSSPSSLLHISGSTPTVRIEGSSTNSAKIDLVGTFTTWSLENQYINGQTNDMFRLYNSSLGADAITVNRGTNNVGIGSTSPSAKLDVVGNIVTSGNVDINGTELTIGTNDTRLAENNLRFKSSGDAYIDHYTTNQSIRIRTSNASALDTEAIIITGGGNFLMGNTVVNPASGFADQTGIGLKYSTTTPSLEVSSDSVALNLNRTTTGGAGVIAELRSANNVRHSFGTANSYMLGNVGIGTTSLLGVLHINTGTAGIAVDIPNQASGTISFANGSGGTAVPNIVAKSANNLGLNIVSAVPDTPAAGLDMVFNVVETDNTDFATLTSTAFRFSRAGNSLLEIKRNGNVGIGATTPSYKLDVNGSARVGNFLTFSTGTSIPSAAISYHTNGYLYIKGGGSGAAIGDDNFATSVYCIDNGNIEFNTAGTGTKMVINSSGNVGIGITSPAHKLHIGSAYNDTIVLDDARSSGDTGTRFDSSIVWDAYYDQAARISLEHNDLNVGYRKLKFQVSGTTPGTYNDGIVLQQNGNVGIGTTSANEKLHVSGDVKVTGRVYVKQSDTTNITPSSGDWVNIAQLGYGEHHGVVAFEWNGLSAPGSAHHGWMEIEVGTYYSSNYNYGWDTYLEVKKTLAHNDFWIDEVRAVDGGSVVTIQVKVNRSVSAGSFRSYVLSVNQGDINTIEPIVDSTSYSTVLKQLNLGTVGSGRAQVAFANKARFRDTVIFDGYVQKPNNPAFKAYDSTGTTWSAGVIVPNVEVFDIGGNYNTSNGIFTAPLDGVYLFRADWRTQSTSGGYIDIRTSVSDLTRHEEASGDVNPYHQSLVMIAKLSAGDTAYLWSSGTVRWDNSAIDNFSGVYLG